MIEYVERLGVRLLGRVIPTATAEATQCCGTGCSYQYRCTSSGYYQRRWCCSQCSCAISCTSWTTLYFGC